MRARIGTLVLAVGLLGTACEDDASAGSTGAPATTAAATTTAEAGAETTTAAATDGAAGEAGTGSLLLLADDFTDGDTDGWDVDYGWYLLGSGEDFRPASSGEAWMWWPDGEAWPARYVLRCSFRVDGGGLAVSLGVGSEGRYVIHLHEEGTDLLFDRPWGTFETLASGPAVAPSEWHLLTASVAVGEIQAYVDGEPIVGAIVDAPLPGGSVGFGALTGSAVSFDNVSVNLLAGGLPPLAGPPPEPEPAAAPEPPPVEEPPEEEPSQEPPEEPVAGGLPDLVVTNVVFWNTIVAADEELPITVWVVNEGTEPVQAFEVAWEAMGAVCIGAEDEIAPGERAYVSCTAPGLPSGLHRWTVHVDHDDRIAEADEGNNVLTGVLEVVPEALTVPDLVIYAATAGTPVAGEPFVVDVGITDDNETQWEGAFTVHFVLDGVTVCSNREEGNSVPRSICTLPAMTVGPHVLEIVVDPANEVEETRDDNNTLVREYQVVG